MYNGLLDASRSSAPKSGAGGGGAAGAPRARRAPGAIPPSGRGAAGPVSCPPPARRRREEARLPAEGIALPPRSPAARPGVPAGQSPPPPPAVARPPPPPPAPEPPSGTARRCHGRAARPWVDPFTWAVPRRSGESPAPAAGTFKDGARPVEVKKFFFPPAWLSWKVVRQQRCKRHGWSNGQGDLAWVPGRPPRAVRRPAKPPVIGFPSFSPSDCGRVRHALLKQPQPPEDEVLC